MENHSIEGVRHVFSRACTVHLPKKPMAHMLWAAFEEQQGKKENVQLIYFNLFYVNEWLFYLYAYLCLSVYKDQKRAWIPLGLCLTDGCGC